MNACQVKKGEQGNLEYFKPKNNEGIFKSNINLISCIKPFNKEEIKVNENYLFYENMEENDIVNSFFYSPEDDFGEWVEDDQSENSFSFYCNESTLCKTDDDLKNKLQDELL